MAASQKETRPLPHHRLILPEDAFHSKLALQWNQDAEAAAALAGVSRGVERGP
jgi:hypothetical protein